MTCEALLNRQYNLTVYESQRGGFHPCCALCIGRLACRTRRDSFDSICAQSCFLSYTPGLHGHRLAVADRCGCVRHFVFRLQRVWTAGDESDISASTHADANIHPYSTSHRNQNILTNSYAYTHCYHHTGCYFNFCGSAFSDFYCYRNAFANGDVDLNANPKSDSVGHCFCYPNVDSSSDCFGYAIANSHIFANTCTECNIYK